MKKIKPGSRAWIKHAHELALSRVPNIFACGKCNYPVIKGFCCDFCKDTDPDRNHKGQNVSQDFYW